MGIDEIDGAEIPACVAHAQSRQMPIAPWDLEPAAGEAERAVAAALCAVDLRPEGAAQLLASFVLVDKGGDPFTGRPSSGRAP